MKLINYINRKMSVKSQRITIISYLFFGYPIGQIFSTLLIIYAGGGVKNIHYQPYITTFIISVLILSPIIISYYLNVKKYKNFIKKVKDKNEIKVICLYNISAFIKNNKYDVICYDIGKNELFIHNGREILYLKDNINYFDIDDLSENRRRKLKKLNRRLF